MVKYCPECGAELKKGYKFCGKCGSEILEKESIKKEPEKIVDRKTKTEVTEEKTESEEKKPTEKLKESHAKEKPIEKEIDKELKKIEESISRKTIEKEPKNVEERLSEQSRDESLDVRKEKEKKEPKTSKKEVKTAAKKKPIYKEIEKKVMTRTKKIAIIAPIIIILSIALFLIVDADGDGLNNLAEIQHGTAMFNSDSDYDGLSDRAEIDTYGTDPLNDDSDTDGLDDNMEINIYHTNPLDADYDNDGLEDGDEVQLGTNLFDSDTDDDGYNDGSDPHPTEHEWKFMDSDNDGWSDYKEYYEEGTDRFNSDTDGDGAPDGYDAHPLSTAKKTRKYYDWEYPEGNTWTWEIYVSYDLYVYESQLDRIRSWSEWSEYTLDPTAKQFATGLKEAANEKGFTYYQTVDFVLAFVQSLPYTSDDVTTGADEYPRYPLETLYEDGGDCEDTSILFSSILREMNYDTCLSILPGHAMVGVLGHSDYQGSYYTKNGKKYYPCETTGGDWKMGELPSSFSSSQAILYNVDVSNPMTPPMPTPKVTLTSQYSSEGYEGLDKVGYVYITVKNNGDSGIGTVYVKVTQGSNEWTKSESAYLETGESRSLTFRFAEIEFWTLDPWYFSAWVV